jgi:hypothetical protein
MTGGDAGLKTDINQFAIPTALRGAGSLGLRPARDSVAYLAAPSNRLSVSFFLLIPDFSRFLETARPHAEALGHK